MILIIALALVFALILTLAAWTIDNVIAWAHLPKPYKGDI